jgi:hypothetical protein
MFHRIEANKIQHACSAMLRAGPIAKVIGLQRVVVSKFAQLDSLLDPTRLPFATHRLPGERLVTSQKVLPLMLKS